MPLIILTIAALYLFAPGRAAAQELAAVVAPDGSAIVSLPHGWNITGAFEGTLDIAGPQGQVLGLGAYAAMMGSAPDPASGILTYLRGQPLAIRPVILESSPTAPLIGGGRSANLIIASELNGRRYRSLVSVTTAPIGYGTYGTWMLYFSFAGAPSDRFERDLPLMRKIWSSWSIHPAVLRGRVDAAQESMLDTYRIWRETMEYRNHVYERANDAWDRVIRGDSGRLRHKPGAYKEGQREWP